MTLVYAPDIEKPIHFPQDVSDRFTNDLNQASTNFVEFEPPGVTAAGYYHIKLGENRLTVYGSIPTKFFDQKLKQGNKWRYTHENFLLLQEYLKSLIQHAGDLEHEEVRAKQQKYIDANTQPNKPTSAPIAP